MSYFFEIKNLNKSFGKLKVLDNVSLNADQGSVFGLLGPNGAGKTTIVRILSTLIPFDSGSVKVSGLNVSEEPEKIRRSIGLAGQFAAVDEYLTGYENVFMIARLYGFNRSQAKKKSTELLDRFDLTEAANRQVRTYSGGMRRRLDLGASLVGDPKILYLDEPTTGLDPNTRRNLWQIVRELVNKGTSILLTTQYMEEADELADKIAVINSGKVIAEGTSAKLKAQLGGDIIELTITNPKESKKALEAISKLATKSPSFDEDSRLIRVPVSNGAKSLTQVVEALSKVKLNIASLSLHQPSLDDVFLSLTGEKAKDTTKSKTGKSTQ